MSTESFLSAQSGKPLPGNPVITTTPNIPQARVSPYVAEYLAAIDRTKQFGFEPPMRVLVRKDCVQMNVVRPLLLDYFSRHSRKELIGQTAAIYFELVQLLGDKTGIPFNLTIGWSVHKGKPMFQHDERLIQRFIERKKKAWMEEGVPFHLWLTSPAFEILDITFAMNMGLAKMRQDCARLLVYQSAYDPPGDTAYHPTIVGQDFFEKTGGLL